jgi:squalene-hopene/tetraprenyl-beta-curcumene cyclase
MEGVVGDRENKLLKRSFTGKSTILRTEANVAASSPAAAIDLVDKVSSAMKKTQSYYLNQQHPDGYWWYELESNVTVTAEYLMLLHFLGLKDKKRDRKIAYHILKNQRSDGTWSIHWGGEGDLSTTVEAYFALKLAGHSQDDPLLIKARQFILDKGGVENSRVFTRIFLALFGEYNWRGIPSIPVEINLIPIWFPVNIYNFSSWARSTIVPLSVALDTKPVKPQGTGVRELYREPHKIPPVTNKKLSLFSWKRFFIILDSLVKIIEDTPLRVLRKRAIAKTEAWILEHQEPSGDWGGIQPAMVNAVLALAALGYDTSDEPVRKGLEALERFTIENDEELYLQSCISPVWDTALTSLALLDSGMDREHPSLIEACKWLASRQILKKGDWSVKRPDLEPGGWAFEFENSCYPDVDDSAVVLMFLSGYADKDLISAENLEKGLRWILGMQGKDGGWGAFDVDNDTRILNQLPYGDLEAMIDPSTPDLAGRVLQLLGQVGRDLTDEVVQKAIKFLKKTQEEDGSWWGRWGVNHIYGTSAVLTGLAAIREDMSAPYVRKAVRWFKKHQNHDGGWGECCESYGDTSLKCRGASTPSQTAWAVLALIAAGETSCEEVTRGINYLFIRQKDDGTWDEEWFTGTGFPKYFMLRYHNYRNCFPLMALGKFYSALRAQEPLR